MHRAIRASTYRSAPSATHRPVTPKLLVALAVLLAAWSLSTPSQAATGLDLGDTAPAITPDALMNGDFDPSVLEGKAVVLEFWATWCAPCVEAIPHWNELVEEFADEDVVFLSISDESKRILRPFLREYPLAGLVAIDEDRSTFDAFEVGGIPRTFLIDARGRIQADTHPALLQAEHIRTLLSGKRPGVGADLGNGMTIEQLAASAQSEPIFRAIIRPAAQSEKGMMTGGHGRFWSLNLPLSMALQQAYDVSPARLVIEAELPEGKFDLMFDVGEDNDAGPVVRLALENAFGLTSSQERRQVDALVLRALPTASDKLPAGIPGGRTTLRPGAVQGSNLSMSALASVLERLVRQPIFDETQLDGRYEVDLAWDVKSIESLQQTLRDDYGLELVEEKREAEVTVIQRVPTGNSSEAPAHD